MINLYIYNYNSCKSTKSTNFKMRYFFFQETAYYNDKNYSLAAK